jgi:hypothetical protein
METVISILAVLLTVSAFFNAYMLDGLNLLKKEVFQLEEKLKRWEKNGIIRDRRTGRYVPKSKTNDS